MINWKNPKNELPKDGQTVWVASFHKENFMPSSVEINCGQVEWSNDRKACRVSNNDAIGSGSLSWYLWQDEEYEFYGGWADEHKDAWAPVDEINLPTWYPRNNEK